MRRNLIAIVSLLALEITAEAATIRVPQDYPTIQAAIDAAHSFDLVLVSPGVYPEHIDFHSKVLSVKSTEGAATTVIDAGGSGSCASFQGGETPFSVLEGFTLTGGKGTYLIVGKFGGGVFCYNAGPTIRGNIISGNSADSGAGLFGYNSGAVIEGNYVHDNAATSTGAAMLLQSGNYLVSNNIVVDNDGNGTGGIDVIRATAVLTNNTISKNHSSFQGGGVTLHDNADVVMTNTIVWNNNYEILIISGTLAASYCDVRGGWPGTGNIDVDPEFVNSVDFHLSSTSPCIGVADGTAPGLPDTDFDGDPRILYGAPDIGADEFADCYVAFKIIGQGMPGSGGYVPQLLGSGDICSAGYQVEISEGLGGASGHLWIGTSSGDLFPFYGGHLYVGLGTPWVIVPIKLQGPAGVPGAGSLMFPSIDLTSFGSFTVYLQSTFLDGGVPQGITLSNALEMRVVH